MRQYIKEACEEIDAAMFSGDDFENIEARIELKEYIGRWQREMKLKGEEYGNTNT